MDSLEPATFAVLGRVLATVADATATASAKQTSQINATSLIANGAVNISARKTETAPKTVLVRARGPVLLPALPEEADHATQ